MTSLDFPVGAYFYPFTNTCKEVASRAEAIGYQQVDETELVKQAQPLFPGHDQPHTYCLGDPAVTNWDNADPTTMGVQIELMQETGLDFAVFDTYGGMRHGRKVREYEKPITTFLEGSHRNIGFGIMWCIDSPRVMLPVPPDADLKKEPGRAYDVTSDTAHFIVDECVKKYWSDPNYLLIDDRPYLSLYNSVVAAGKTAADPFHDFAYEIKDYAVKQYGIDPYLVAVNRGLRRAIADVIDGASGYALLPDFSGDNPIQDYNELVDGCPERWQTIANGLTVPFVPPAVLGWDASPRGTPGQRLEDVADKYPYVPIVTGSTPEKAAEMLEATLAWTVERVPPAERYGIICAWNEISEKAALLPTVINGEADFSYLNAIASVLRK
jgi:hypothetical protein